MLRRAARRRIARRRPIKFGTRDALGSDKRLEAADAWAAWQEFCEEATCPDELREIRPNSDGPPQVAVLYSGGIGDVLQACAMIAALKHDLAPCNVTLLHGNRAAPAVARGNNSVEKIVVVAWSNYKRLRSILSQIPLFDLVVDVRYCIRYLVPPESRMPDFMAEQRILSAGVFVRPWLNYLDDFPFRNNQFGRAAQRAGLRLMDLTGMSGALDLTQDSPLPFVPDAESLDVVLGLLPIPYVTIHNGVDENHALSAADPPASGGGYAATKMLPLGTWEIVVAKLKAAGFATAQVGLKQEELIPGVTHDLRGLTSLSEVALVIKYGNCHIDTEGGLVHLARAVNQRSVVMFGPTPVEFFGYRQNVNLSPSSCGDCWWIASDWLQRCTRGTLGPECMLEHRAEDIVAAALSVSRGKRIARVDLLSAELFSVASLRSFADLCRGIYTACDLTFESVSTPAHDAATGACIQGAQNWQYPFVLKALRRANPHRPHGLRIANVGGGRGALSFVLGQTGAEVEVIDREFRTPPVGDPDVENRFIGACRRIGRARFGAIYNLPGDDESFDVVVCVGALENVRHKRQALAELLRILKPDGLLVLSVTLVDTGETAERGFDGKSRSALGLLTLREELRIIGVGHLPFDAAGLRCSVGEVQELGLSDLPADGTVAGLVLRKQRPEPDECIRTS